MYLRVLKRTYIPTDMTAEMIQIFSQAVRRYIETVDYNLGRGKSEEKRFDRMVYPDDGLRVVDVEIFQQEIREYFETVIQEIDQKSATYPRPARRKGEKGGAGRRWNLFLSRSRMKTARHSLRTLGISRSLRTTIWMIDVMSNWEGFDTMQEHDLGWGLIGAQSNEN